MKRWFLVLLTLIILIPCLGSRRRVVEGAAGFAAAGGPSLLVNQNFEGTGYDNSETWTEDGADPDCTAAPCPLEGSQSLRVSAAFASTYTTFSGQTTVYSFCDFVIDAATSSATPRAVFSLRASDDTVLASCRIETDGQVYLFANGADSAASATTLSVDTEYHIWLKFVSAGTCELAMSTTTTKPTSDGSGNVFLTKTGASGTAARIKCETFDGNQVYDHVLVDDEVIGDAP